MASCKIILSFLHSLTLLSFFDYLLIYLSVLPAACLFQSSWFSSLPYLGQWIFANIYGTFADTLLKRKKLSLLRVRRLSTFVCEYLV